MPTHWKRDSLLTRDISRPLTRGVVALTAFIVATLGYYRGVTGVLDALAYLGGLGLLLALYLTYRRQWPRLIGYIRELRRRY